MSGLHSDSDIGYARRVSCWAVAISLRFKRNRRNGGARAQGRDGNRCETLIPHGAEIVE